MKLKFYPATLHCVYSLHYYSQIVRMASNNVFQVMDPVHGSIELKDERGILRAIIDSEQFQRLRKVKQLGKRRIIDC